MKTKTVTTIAGAAAVKSGFKKKDSQPTPSPQTPQPVGGLK
jgi:hypothetical protein